MGERTIELLILIVGDALMFISALWVTLLVRYQSWPSATNLELHLVPFLWLTFIWIFVFYIGGLYDKHTTVLKSLLLSRILNIQVVNIIIAALLFALVPFGITPKTNLVIYLVISLIFLTTWRLYLFNLFSSKNTHKAILLADGKEAIELVDEVNNNDRYNYRFLRLIDEATASAPNLEEKLFSLIEKEKIKIIVANPHSPYLQQILPKLFDLSFINFELTFLDFHQVYEDIFDRVPLSSLQYDWFLGNVSQSQNLLYTFCKRLIDIVGSLFLGLLLLLLLPLIYILVRLEGRGPLFIAQERIGQYNRIVKIYKIRTMTFNQSASATWIKEDAKGGNQITRVGAVLRKLSIDELPQVWTILKGEMSLIGPRNDIVGLGERLATEIPYYHIRNLVKPGVTGWAQTNQHYMGDNISPQSLEESRVRLSYDLYYVKNRSLLLDVAVALKTIKTLCSRFGIVIKLRR